MVKADMGNGVKWKIFMRLENNGCCCEGSGETGEMMISGKFWSNDLE